jgi:iron(III) transport system substrate-binding protein
LTTAQAIATAFERKYPQFKVQIYRTTSEQLVNRISTEKRVGKILFDIAYGGSVPMMTELGVLTPYLSSEAKALPDTFRGPDNLWTAISTNYYVLGYNTQSVSGAKAPTDWWDLLDSRWHGNLAMDPEEYAWLGAMEEYFGEKKAAALMTGLARQGIRWRKGHVLLGELMAAGEYPMTVVYSRTVEALKRKGAPVEWVRTTKPLVASLTGIGVSKKPGGDGARLFIDFALSRDGQKIILAENTMPIRADVIASDSGINPARLTIQPISYKIIANLNNYMGKFDRIFGPRK